jgi:hypothetical protein
VTKAHASVYDVLRLPCHGALPQAGWHS